MTLGSNTTAFNYAAFEQPVTAEDRIAYGKKPNKVLRGIGLAAIGVFFGLPLLTAIANRNATTVIILSVFLGFGYLIYAAVRKANNTIITQQKFAANNQLRFMDRTYPLRNDGAIFTSGDSRAYAGGFELADGSLSVANYQYVVGSGKNRSTVTWGVMHAKLSRNLPNVVLDAKSNNMFKRMSNLPASFHGGQKFELEGNFNQYFSVYAPAGFQRDALYFLTPELMEALIQYGASYDFEVIDNNLFIYKSGAFKFNKQMLPEIFQTIKYFGWQFEDNVNKYRDDRVANAKVSNVVSAEGTRLKRKFSWFAFIFFILFLVFQVLNLIGSFR